MRISRAYLPAWTFTCTIALGVSLAPPATGQTPPETSQANDNADEKVIAHYERGRTAAKAEEWEKAREAFLAAWQLKRHTQIALNLGRAELKLGLHRDAAEHFGYVLHEAKDLSDEDRNAVQGLFDQARAKVAVITIRVDVPGAEVLMDGKVVGRAPLADAVIVEPGRRLVFARSPGHESASVHVEATAGGTQQISLTLVKLGAGAGAGAGGGKEASAQGARTERKANIVPPAPDAGNPWKPLALGAGVGFAAIGIGMGVGFTVAANERSKSAADQLIRLQELTEKGIPVCGKGSPKLSGRDCAALRQTLREKDRFERVAIAGSITGGLLSAGSFVFALRPAGKPRPQASVRVRPIVAPTYGGLLVTGSF